MIQDYLHFIKRCWPLLCFGTLTVFWGNFGQSFFISWFGASFQEALQLSATDYGTAYSAATLLSGLLLMWLGAYIDTVPLRLFVSFAAVGLFCATLVLWQVDSVLGLFVGLFMLRFFGQGLLPHTGVTTMAREFTLNRGKAISIAACGVPLGEIFLPSMVVVIITALGWQQSWLVIGLLIPFVYLPLAHLLLAKDSGGNYLEEVDRQETPNSAKTIKDQSRRIVLADFRFWIVLPALLAAPFIVTGLFIHQPFFLSQMGWSPPLFASCFIFYGVCHWSSSMFTGGLVDRYSGVRLIRFFLLPMLLGLLVPAFLKGDWVAYILMIMLGTSIGASGPVVSALWAEIYGTKHLGSIRAMVSSFAVISTSVSPILFGYLIDSGIEARRLFLYLTGYVCVAMVLSIFSYSEKEVLS